MRVCMRAYSLKLKTYLCNKKKIKRNKKSMRLVAVPPCPWPLDIHAPGCCTSMHLVAGQLGIHALGCWAPCPVGHPCTWLLSVHALCCWVVGRLRAWLLDIRASGCCTSEHLATRQWDVFVLGCWTSVHLGVDVLPIIASRAYMGWVVAKLVG